PFPAPSDRIPRTASLPPCRRSVIENRKSKIPSMFDKVSTDAGFIRGEHEVLAFWKSARIFDKLRAQNKGKPHWSFLDGPITANNPMGVHHAWGRTYKDAFQRYFAMTGR